MADRVELCRIMLPAPMTVVGIVGQTLGKRLPTAVVTMHGDYMSVEVDLDDLDAAAKHYDDDEDDE